MSKKFAENPRREREKRHNYIRFAHCKFVVKHTSCNVAKVFFKSLTVKGTVSRDGG
jgi:hypothetical protein